MLLDQANFSVFHVNFQFQNGTYFKPHFNHFIRLSLWVWAAGERSRSRTFQEGFLSPLVENNDGTKYNNKKMRFQSGALK